VTAPPHRPAPVATDVLVEHRIHAGRARPAVQVGRLLMRDEDYHRNAGRRRYFWLLDEGVQRVYEPFGWSKEWYVDVVSFSYGTADGRRVVRVEDRWMDVVVEDMGPTYRLIDLDELATGLRGGSMPIEVAAAALDAAQRFTDTHLHRGATFPPAALRPFFAADHDYPPFPE
jgi:hypothetical protein